MYLHSENYTNFWFGSNFRFVDDCCEIDISCPRRNFSNSDTLASNCMISYNLLDCLVLSERDPTKRQAHKVTNFEGHK